MIITGFSPSSPSDHHGDGRHLLSRMLSRFLGIENAEVATDELGKPRTEGAVFSISHSGEMVMCSIFVAGKDSSLPVLSEGCEISLNGEGFFAMDAEACFDIGADMELISLPRSADRLQALAKRYFSAAEQEYLSREDGDLREKFYRLWTEKESYLKLTGEGLSGMCTADTFALPEGIFRKSFRISYGNGKYSASICYRGW